MATDRRDPFTASMPAAATATATGGTLVGACGTLLTHLWWVKRDGTIQRVWLLSMTRPSLIPFSYRFFLFPPRCPLLVMYLGGWTGTVWTTCHTPSPRPWSMQCQSLGVGTLLINRGLYEYLCFQSQNGSAVLVLDCGFGGAIGQVLGDIARGPDQWERWGDTKCTMNTPLDQELRLFLGIAESLMSSGLWSR